jgi:hypothetical protein
MFVGYTNDLFIGNTNDLFVGTQDLCVQSNKTGSNIMISIRMERWIGLDAKILRPYKQMFRIYKQMFRIYKQMFRPYKQYPPLHPELNEFTENK